MLDIKAIRQDPKAIEKKLKTKDPSIDLSLLIALDQETRKIQTQTEELKAKQNQASKEIGLKKQRNIKDISSIKAQMLSLSKEIESLHQQLLELEQKRKAALLLLPNTPYDTIKISADPNDNVCIKTHKNKPSFSFSFKNHLQLNESLKLFDFKTSAKITGAGWPLYIDRGALLEWGLINYMLDVHIKNGYKMVLPPLLVRPEILIGSGQLPKFADQQFQIHDEDYSLYLIPTAEVILNGLHYNDIIPYNHLPLHYVSYTPCFRREAGAAGKQERGLIRTHQFNKVEIFCLCDPEKSDDIFEKMLCSAEEVLKGLDLHYRNMLLVTGDTSFSAAKTVDIEVWLPGQNRYYEVSSISNCTDFQARRSKIRAKKGQDKPYLIHTLNGSGLATSRLMVALLENFQQEDGSIILPTILEKYIPKEMMTLKPF